MNIEQAGELSNNDLKIEIAELCGWKLEKDQYSPKGIWVKRDIFGKKTEECFDMVDLPDYPNDLNAMHEAEKMLDVVEQRPLRSSIYLDCLGDVTGTTRMGLQQEIVMATARQRAEAFVVVMEKS